MSWRTIALLLALALPATGCWMEACTYGSPSPPSYRSVCTDQLTGILVLGDPDALDWCGGDHHPFESCDSLGYTAECGDWSYLPDSPALLECQSSP